MNDRNRKRLRRGESVRDFTSNLPLPLTQGGKGAEIVARINQLVQRINALDAASATNARTLRAIVDAKKEARKELREFLRTISARHAPSASTTPHLRRSSACRSAP